jgi:hypothetical protein
MSQFFKFLITCVLFLLLAFALDACKSKGPYNPYLKMKHKPSEVLKKANAENTKKGSRAYDRQLGNNRKQVFGRRKPPKA